jgi:hypothetical protein
MTGNKTREQQRRILEGKDDMPDPRQLEAERQAGSDRPTPRPEHPEARQSEFAVSAGGLNQESDHHKHNDPGQTGHKPQKHSRAEEGS